MARPPQPQPVAMAFPCRYRHRPPYRATARGQGQISSRRIAMRYIVTLGCSLLPLPLRSPILAQPHCPPTFCPDRDTDRYSHEVGDEAALPMMNLLKISGSFSLPEVHSWVVACLPEVPARLQGEEASFAFRNTFLDTLLLCDYRRGEATFRSDSLTTLAIVKEVVTKEATARKIQIQVRGGAASEREEGR